MASLIKKVAPLIVVCFGCTSAMGQVWIYSEWWLGYASELFGPGHEPIEWPERYPQQLTLQLGGNTDWARSTTTNEAIYQWGSQNAGVAEITITLEGEATFAGNITGLTWDPNAADNWHEDDDNDPNTPANNDEDNDPNTFDVANETEPVTAPGTVASIVAGGRTGDNFVTIRIEAPGDTSESNIPSNAAQAAAASTRNTAAYQWIHIPVPRLANLDALAGATGTPQSPYEQSDALKIVHFFAESRLISGSFPDEPVLGSEHPRPLVRSIDWVTLDIGEDNTRLVGIEAAGDDAAFRHLKLTRDEVAAHDDGTIRLGSVTISTSQVHPGYLAVDQREAADVFQIRNAAGTDTGVVYRPERQAQSARYFSVLDLDGQWLSSGRVGLRGAFRVTAEGTRGLFNDGDVLFVDYDRDGKMGSGEELVLDGAKGVGTSLSIDFDALESFKNPTWGRYEGVFDVYYRPGGKQPYNHGAEIKLTASVDYSDPSAIDEKDVTATTTFKFEGVESEVLAYAIPFAGNGKGDVANVRVRCENVAGCRVFVECTGDDAVRSFGEAGVLEHEKLMKWDSARLESIIGSADANSRHSCRILSKGKVRVQQLTRDGVSNTLVNNTYVGG